MKRKILSADGLISILKKSFSTFSDSRGSKIKIKLEDAFLTAYAAFSLKYDSFNSFFDDLDKSESKRVSVQHLFQVKDVPSATRLKEIIDPIPSEYLRPAFNNIFRELQRGKVLEKFQFLEKYYILALDGTQTFQSDKIHCKKCLVKEHKNGKLSYSHQMLAGCIVHPLMKQVIPVAPEPIQNDDGSTKNDCERNAAKRFLKRFREDHPKLPVVVTEDGLASNGPHIRDLKSHDMSFILGAKPSDHKYLFDWVNTLDELEVATRHYFEGKKIIRRTTQTIRFANDVPLNDANHDLLVNFLELTEVVEKKVEKISHDKNGIATINYEWVKEKEKPLKFSWVTDIKITKQNVFALMSAGRKRWAIENETFNTLKNQGYNFERNFGHGSENLATNFALLMMLAFFVDQAQELCCKTFQQALEKVKRKKYLWRKLLSKFEEFTIKTDWHGLFMTILNPSKIEINSC